MLFMYFDCLLFGFYLNKCFIKIIYILIVLVIVSIEYILWFLCLKVFFYDNDYFIIKDFYVWFVDMICICFYMFIGVIVFFVVLFLKIYVLLMFDYYIFV